jgi:RNA-binding protein YhbY
MSSPEVDEVLEEDECVLTPTQVKILRKEADRRKNTSTIATLVLPPDESDGSYSGDTLSSLSKLFEENELVEVRAISKERKKEARTVAERLAFRLEGEVEKPVVVINLKGHVAMLYAPFEDGHAEKIILRTSYQKGQWTRRPKAVRDSRGQIMRDKEGKSIRE